LITHDAGEVNGELPPEPVVAERTHVSGELRKASPISANASAPERPSWTRYRPPSKVATANSAVKAR
jgi:hypothetical protein